MPRASEPIWAVVHVYRGIPVAVEGYRSEDAAQRRADDLRLEINLEDDAVAVFEVDAQ